MVGGGTPNYGGKYVRWRNTDHGGKIWSVAEHRPWGKVES